MKDEAAFDVATRRSFQLICAQRVVRREETKDMNVSLESQRVDLTAELSLPLVFLTA